MYWRKSQYCPAIGDSDDLWCYNVFKSYCVVWKGIFYVNFGVVTVGKFLETLHKKGILPLDFVKCIHVIIDVYVNKFQGILIWMSHSGTLTDQHTRHPALITMNFDPEYQSVKSARYGY